MNNNPLAGAIPKINPQIVITFDPETRRISAVPNFSNPQMILVMLSDARDAFLRNIAKTELTAELLKENGGLVDAEGKPMLTSAMLKKFGGV